MTRDVDHGSRFPLGATDVGDGVNFSVYSKNSSSSVYQTLRFRGRPVEIQVLMLYDLAIGKTSGQNPHERCRILYH